MAAFAASLQKSGVEYTNFPNIHSGFPYLIGFKSDNCTATFTLLERGKGKAIPVTGREGL
jgi:hypothetical protein